MRKIPHQELLQRQQMLARQPRLPFTIILNDIRSLYNVGSIFRTADGVGVEKIWLCGITGYPPQQQISKTALGAEERVAWDHHENAEDVAVSLKKAGYQIILLEQTEQSLPYEQFAPESSVCLVLGHEVAGVAESLLPLCDAAVDIAMVGLKNSLNVGVAFGIVAYHIRHQLLSVR